MSSSSATGATSRSSSPATPDSSDSHDAVFINNGLEPVWYNPDSFNPVGSFDGVSPQLMDKRPDEAMLGLDDLLESNAFFDMRTSTPSPQMSTLSTTDFVPNSQGPTFNDLHPELIVPLSPPSLSTQPVPPPITIPRPAAPSAPASSDVVFPPRASCQNLSILTPSIPETGARSRVETQIKVTVDLGRMIGTSTEPNKYERIGSWNWLKLPPGTSTKRRARKEPKIDADPADVLNLNIRVSCASPPFNEVVSCASCQGRESKRLARKIAARVRPARSDSDSPDSKSENRPSKHEDITSIVQFNCPELLDFSTGSVILPLRITCYCRHHREKVGFHVHLSMTDNTGRVVGTGTTHPIMITDDHKSKHPSTAVAQVMAIEAGRPTSLVLTDLTEGGAPSKRRAVQMKKRPKPYDSARSSPKYHREGSIGSSFTPSTRSPSPGVARPDSSSLLPLNEILLNNPHVQAAQSLSPPDAMLNPTMSFDFAADTGGQVMATATSLAPTSMHPLPGMMSHNMPYMFFDSPSTSVPLLPTPKIHRLIPSVGPIIGGIEVTVLGANFHPSMQLKCVFGDVVASSTQRWSDNTLLCVLPPRTTPGVVAVWFEGMESDNDGSPPSLFHYTDESDRALMELALQVVGLKMTGKIEDAKNVAMRIVGTQPENNGSSSNMQSTDASGAMQLALSANSAPRYQDLRLHSIHSNTAETLEDMVLKSLMVLDTRLDGGESRSIPTAKAISLQTSSGQTLLHLATFLGFTKLMIFLIGHGIDVDMRDKNGYTALHFAALLNSRECAAVLLEAGADVEIVNVLGKTAEEIGSEGFFERAWLTVQSNDNEAEQASDDESNWGDAEGDEEVVAAPRLIRRRGTRLRRSSQLSLHDPSATDSPTATEAPTPKATDTQTKSKADDAKLDDEKQAASFADVIQRTLAQLTPQGAQAMIPNMSQFSNLPHFPGMPNVPWMALPQIPMVFPVMLPPTAWPSFFTDKRQQTQEQNGGEDGKAVATDADATVPSAIPSTAQEWRAMWEKWLTQALAATTAMRQNEEAPPVYTPRNTPAVEAVTTMRRPEYSAEEPPVVDEREVDEFAYRPPPVHEQKAKQKNDMMLYLFWIPVLSLSLIWGLLVGTRTAIQIFGTALPTGT